LRKTISSDDLLLVPKYSDIESRSEVDISVNLGDGRLLSSPIVAAPMDTICGKNMSSTLADMGLLPIIHRYNSIEEQCEIAIAALEQNCNRSPIGVAVGATGDYLDRAKKLASYGVEIICIDVAHGHHIMVERAIKTIKDKLGKVHIMAGNIATLEAFNDLSDWGADSIRCGIGGGSICSTRLQTGHGVPTIQTILDVSDTDRKSLIIADGGIKNSGDIVKAIAAGADMVMIGSLISGTEETPGDVIVDNQGRKRKMYRGMASKGAQRDWRGKVSSIEGVTTTVSYKGEVKNVIGELHIGIRSGLSYSGARSIQELQNRATFVQQTIGGQTESSTHIVGR
jgi:IMP dehydrogenase